METLTQLSKTELESGLDDIRQAPSDHGVLKMIVRRPNEDERELVDEAELTLEEGLIGDTWKVRGSKSTEDGSASLQAQITIMNARTAALVAQSEERWALAGDQLYVDMNRSEERRVGKECRL